MVVLETVAGHQQVTGNDELVRLVRLLDEHVGNQTTGARRRVFRPSTLAGQTQNAPHDRAVIVMIVLHASHNRSRLFRLRASVAQRNGVHQVSGQPLPPLLQTYLVQQGSFLIEEGHNLVIDLGTDRDSFRANRRPRLDLLGVALLYLGH
ncbi:hypothetical protein D3C85_1397520 [compost metagenome]